MKRLFVPVLALGVAVALILAGCSPAAPPAPTQAPATKVPEPAKPPATVAAPTKAPEPTRAAPAPTSAPAPQPTAVPAKKVDFPTKGKAITLIVPWAAGSSSDISGRFIASGLEKELGTAVQVVNRSGASSQVGLTELAAAKPDGYTIAQVSMPTASLIYLDPSRKATFNRKSFQAVAHFISEPLSVIVKGDSPYKTVKDMVDASKAKPGQIKVATSGLKAISHVSFALWEKLAGAQFTYVHFDGGGPALTAVLGGHADTNGAAPMLLAPQVKSGEIRAVAVMDKEPSKFLPGVPTMESQGYKLYMVSTRGLVAPAGTPREIVDVLSDAVKRVMSSEELRKRMDDMALGALYMDSATYGPYWDELDTVMAPLIKELPD